MPYLIKEILINGDSSYKSSQGEENILKNLSKINIFIGANNSGKSRMLRSLFQEENSFFLPSDIDLDEVNNIISSLKNDLLNVFNRHGIVGYGALMKENIEKINEIKKVCANDDFMREFYEYITISSNFVGQPGVHYIGSYTSIVNHAQINEEMKKISNTSKMKMEGIVGERKIYKFVKVYIPTLRGLRGFNNNDNVYLRRTKSDYFKGNENVKIFTGLDMYEEVTDLLLGNLEEREKITDFQEFLSKSFFDGQEVTLIPNRKSDVLHVKIGDEIEKPIYDLGDGIQSLIILTFPLFKFKNENLLLFIEEPELFLHPGMQRKFLEIIMNDEFGNYQYFITTHSNHFLDITLDMDKISIYTFRKELEDSSIKEKSASFIMENVSNEENNILKMLGVRNSAIFLSNCTIWVEGITDRYYIKHFFELYQKSKKGIKYKEDYHFSFVEYSGNNITHWSFLDDETMEDGTFSSINENRICGTLFLITDKDSKKKEKRQEKLSEKLGDRYYCLNCREIENILSVQTIKKVIATYEKVDIENLQFNNEFSEDSYKEQSLGTFIDKILKNKKRQGSYASASGTVSDKVGFCKRAISSMKSIDDLSQEARLLCEKLYSFIASNNYNR